jgi:peptidyl-prolyl cis-trans isomerase SurA
MLRKWNVWLLFCCLQAGAVIVDRIAVIVDKHVIKSSDIERDLRSTQFLNRDPLELSADAKRKSAERLIDQSVIREEMEKGAYSRASATDVEGMWKKLLAERFGGSTARLREELAKYGLTEEQLRTQLQWQMDVLKFIDQRFRPGVLVTDDEVKSYYDQHAAELKRQFPQLTAYAAMEPKVRVSLEGERLNRNFDEWIAETRKRARIEYRQGAFQ